MSVGPATEEATGEEGFQAVDGGLPGFQLASRKF